MEAFENRTFMKGFERFCITSFFATMQIRRPESLCKKIALHFQHHKKKTSLH